MECGPPSACTCKYREGVFERRPPGADLVRVGITHPPKFSKFGRLGMLILNKCGSPLVRDTFSRKLRVNNVARRLGLSRRTVRHLAQTGRLRAQKVRKKIWVFVSTDVDEFHAWRETRHV